MRRPWVLRLTFFLMGVLLAIASVTIAFGNLEREEDLQRRVMALIRRLVLP